MTVESWRPIPGFAGYEASDLGRIRSTRRCGPKTECPHLLKLRAAGRYGEYRQVELYGRTYTVQRLVLLAFVGPPPGLDYDADHRDNNPGNNTLANLAWEHKDQNRKVLPRQRGTRKRKAA